jgi:hypothetical protein
MRVKTLSIAIAFLLVINSFSVIKAQASDQITKNDFTVGSFSKTIDLFEYARTHAEAIGGTPPPADWTSDTVVNYINQNGLKLLYMGFAGVDYGKAKFQLPLQSIVERFNTTKGEPAITASSFLMLMAFNDTKASAYPGSPDKEDNLWASFSMGTDFTEILPEGKTPKMITSVEVTPLKNSGNEYTWGMKYKYLAAIWWRVAGSGPKLLPTALCVYDELGFNYRLVFNQSDGTAKLYITYTIGEMRDLWTVGYLGLLPIVTHFNSTGTYNLRQQKIGAENIHGFLERNKISMSIVMGQRTWVADKEVSNKVNGQTAVTEGVDVTSASIQSTTTDGQKVFDAAFGEKKTYKLETTSGEKTYNSVTRIADVTFYAKNPILRLQNSLLYYGNAIVSQIFPLKYAEMAKVWMNATKADYLYVTSYPTYDGYKVIHDPVLTAYIPPVKTSQGGGVPIPEATVFIGVGIVVLFLMRRRTLDAQGNGVITGL